MWVRHGWQAAGFNPPIHRELALGFGLFALVLAIVMCEVVVSHAGQCTGV